VAVPDLPNTGNFRERRLRFSERDRHVLDAMRNDLAASDPHLAGLLGTFTRLTAGEQMPAREQLRAAWRHPMRSGRDVTRKLARPSRQVPGHGIQRLGLARGLMLLWLLASVALISLAVALSSATTASCPSARGAGCDQPAPTSAAHS
jgi:predicted small secreted protein